MTLLAIEEAQAAILGDLAPLAAESVALHDALGRVLAADVRAGRTLPAFANSSMDGYAVRAADLPGTLRVIETVPAGSVAGGGVGRGQAMRIFTGAPIPPGADAVVMQEDTERRGDDVVIGVKAGAGKNIRPAGEDVARGDLLQRAGDVVSAGTIGMLAAQGQLVVSVVRRPRVAIVPTGDEIVELEREPGPGQVVNSNSVMLAAQVAACGAVPERCPIGPDDPDKLARVLRDASSRADVVLTSGGVSVGDYDHVRRVLADSGSVAFWRVAMKPGKPLAYGRLAGVPLIGLPGNPVSSFVTFEVFARPALRKLAGHTRVHLPRLEAKLVTAQARDKKRRELVRARVERRNDGLWVTPLAKQGSGQMSSLLGAEALIDLAPGEGQAPAGEAVSILLLEPMALVSV